MRISIGVKRLQAERPRACIKPPALDRQRHGLILGYARLPLVSARGPRGFSCFIHDGIDLIIRLVVRVRLLSVFYFVDYTKHHIYTSVAARAVVRYVTSVITKYRQIV